MNIGFLIKISSLILALAAVLFFIQNLKGPVIKNAAQDPNSIIGILVGSDQRLLNWCPVGVTKVEIYKDDGKTLSRSLTSTQDLSAVCEIFVGGFSQGPEAPEFVLKMRAFGQPSEGSVPFEKALNAPIFRYKGMPFASSGLQKSLARLEAP